MNDIYEVIQLKDNHRLQIIQDDNPDSPRSWDNLGIMLCAHSRYSLGDADKTGRIGDKLEMLQRMANDLGIAEVVIDLDMYEEVYYDQEKLQEWLNLRTDWVCLPLYLYDHSGITMSTSAFSCRWDSGQVGYIYCPTDKIIAEYGDTTPEILAKVTSVLEAEVETYDQYLTGDVYGFRLMKVSECDLGHEHEEEIDSCWGFYGHDWKTNGIIDDIPNSLIPKEHMALEGKM